jgi:hypothetical protein
MEEEKQFTISEPALSPPIIKEVAEAILDEGGWSAPVCRRKKELQSRRTKRRLPIVVDGRWQRPVRRWIDLGIQRGNIVLHRKATLGLHVFKQI